MKCSKQELKILVQILRSTVEPWSAQTQNPADGDLVRGMKSETKRCGDVINGILDNLGYDQLDEPK